MKNALFFIIFSCLFYSSCKTPDNSTKNGVGKTTTITTTPAKTTNGSTTTQSNASGLGDAPIVAKMQGRGARVTMSDGDLRKLIYDYVEGSSDLNNFSIISYTEGVYYLGAVGKKDGEKANFAFELTSTENGFAFEKINKPWYVCKKANCDGCAFQPNAQGQIMRCACESEATNPCKFQSGIRSNF